MKLFIPNDDFRLADGLVAHQEGCSCADCCAYDSKRAPLDSDGRGSSGLLSGGAVTGTTGLTGSFDVRESTVTLTSGGGSRATVVSLGLDTIDRAPPTDLVFADTVPGDTSSTVTLAIGSSVNGVLDTLGDHDWYRVTLTAGQTYTFTIGATGAGDIQDSYLRLHNGAGTLIAENDDIAFPGNTYSRIVFTATTSGTYFVNVGAYNDLETGNFRLTAASDLTDSIPGSSATTASLTVDGPAVAGVLDAAGDHDWYRVSLVAGTTYTFFTSATGGANDPDTFIRLFGTDGSTQLAENDDGGGGTYSLIRFTPTTSGTYFLDVGGFNDAASGNYRVAAGLAPPLPVFTNDEIADQLLNGYWGGPQAARHFNVAPGGTITFNVTALTAEGQTLAREAFNLWSDATGITFQEITGAANITLDDNQTGAFANSTRVGNIISSSTVNVSTQWLATYGTGLNTYSFQTYIHEIGHAIGLGHGGPYNGNATYGQDNSYQNDAWATTVMSYFDQTENSYFAAQGFTRQFVVSPIIADVLAVNLAYGTPTTTRTGNTTYGFGNTSGRAIYDATQFPSVTYTVVDHGGIDTLNYSRFTQNQRIDLNQEAFSNVGGRVGNVTIARGSVIENAISGLGNDVVIGNSANNNLSGKAGDDTIDGNAGDDTLNGGAGNDILNGGDGSDRLFGNGGADTMNGGGGNDRLEVDNVGDIANGGDGIDTVEIVTAGLTYTVAGDVEFIGNQSGGDLTITLNALANNYSGSVGVDIVNAGAGQDSVYGRAGNDQLNGQDGNDYLFGDIGNDALDGGDGIDHLEGGLDNDTLIGGVGNDTLYGQDGIDVVNGGAGVDFLNGGAGADRFVFAGGDSGATIATADRIGDFAQGQGDRIDLSAIDAVAGGADNAFSFIGNAAFGNVAGQLRYEQISGVTYVQGDTDGNGVADFIIRLDGLHTLTGGDFLL